MATVDDVEELTDATLAPSAPGDAPPIGSNPSPAWSTPAEHMSVHGESGSTPLQSLFPPGGGFTPADARTLRPASGRSIGLASRDAAAYMRSQLGMGEDSDPDDVQSEAITLASTWRTATVASSPRLTRAFLDVESPQITSAMLDHWVSDEACMHSLMQFIVRPLSAPMHVGAGALGQHAVAIESAIAIAQKLPTPPAAPDTPMSSDSGTGDGVLARLKVLSYEPYGLTFMVDAIRDAARTHAHVPGGASDSDDALSTAGAAAEVDAISGAVNAAHAAAFEAAVADVYHHAAAVSRQWHDLYPDAASRATSHSVLAAVSPPRMGRFAAEDGAAEDLSHDSAIRPVSCLFPRQREEMDALKSLMQRVVDGAPASSSASAPPVGGEAEPAVATPGRSPRPPTAPLPTFAQLRNRCVEEEQAVLRSFRLMRLLCGGTSSADDLLDSRPEDMTKALFNVFTSRYKGSLYHACAVLQRLIQTQPDSVARAVASDSQRYIGSMLLYLHHAPVADTLVQLVLLNHMASAQGGAGPHASLNGGQSPFGGGGGMGGFPFGGGSFGVRSATVTNYDGAMTMYSSRGTAASPPSRPLLWKSLAGWGFMSVLAAHVFRPDYACVPEHVQASADAFVQIVKVLAGDDRADVMLGPVLRSVSTLRGLVTGACWPLPGVDYPRSGKWLRTHDAEDSYAADGLVPARQRECMRVLHELAVLMHSPTVPAPHDSASGMAGFGGGPMAVIQRMVDNGTLRHARVVTRVLVAALPQIGFALCRLQHALQPDVVVVKSGHKAGKHGGKPAAPGAATAQTSSSSGGMVHASSDASIAASTPGVPDGSTTEASTPGDAAAVSTSAAAKKRRKKKKSGAAGGKAAASAGEDAEEHEEAEDAAPTSASAVSVDAPPTAAAVASGSEPSEPVTTTLTATSAANSATSTPATVAPRARARSVAEAATYVHKHPGHAYAAPFGMFRLYAAQLIAVLARSECTIVPPEPLPSPFASGEGDAGASSARSRTESSMDAAGGGEADAHGHTHGDDSDSEHDITDARRGKTKGSKGHKDKKGKGKSHKGGVKKSAGGKGKGRDTSMLVLRDDSEEDESHNVPAFTATLTALSTPASLLPVMPASAEHELRVSWYHARHPRASVSGADGHGRTVSDASSTALGVLQDLSDARMSLSTPASPLPALARSGTAASSISVEAPTVEVGGVLPGASFDPAELWSTLVHWVVTYSHTNLFHVAFTSLLQVVVKHNHEATLRVLLQSARLLTTFINHYEGTAPVSMALERATSDGSTLSSAQERRRARTDASAARGTVLRVLNMLRLASQAQPQTSLLTQHLRDHSLWTSFQPRLRNDSEPLMKPLVPAPPRANAAATASTDSSGGGFRSMLGNLLNPASLLGNLGKGGDKHGAAKAPEDDMDWNLGSPFAKELGMDTLTRHTDAASGAAAAGRKGGAAAGGAPSAGTRGGKAGRSRAGSSDSGSTPDDTSLEALMASLEDAGASPPSGGKGAKAGKKKPATSPVAAASPPAAPNVAAGARGGKGKPTTVSESGNALAAVQHSIDMLDVD